LIAAGGVRIIIRREKLVGGRNSLDWLMLGWASWLVISSVFHKDPSAALVFRLGLALDACGIYFLVRIFCQSLDDVVMICRITVVVLMLVAVEMLYEKLAVHNLFSAVGGVDKIPEIRKGIIRASGSFAHPIIAGTVGSVCLPLIIGLWQQNRKTAFVGIVVCVVMLFASGSSGPIMGALAGLGALFMWRWRHWMRLVRWTAVIGYIMLDFLMKDPAYYIIARIDLVGGSTGWHRAALIEAAFKNLHEWWLGGTDYTRHWMPTGVPWSPDHTDITNYYLHMGVVGGVPLMLLFVAILAKGFSYVRQTLQQLDDLLPGSCFMVWALGSSLFVHAVTCISVSYFDQSFGFLYLTLAAIGSVRLNTESQSMG